MDWASIAVSGIGASVGIISAVLSSRSAKRATESGEQIAKANVEAGAYARAQQMYEGTVTRMQTEIDRQGGQIAALQRQVARLLRQVTDAGLVPATIPEEDP